MEVGYLCDRSSSCRSVEQKFVGGASEWVSRGVQGDGGQAYSLVETEDDAVAASHAIGEVRNVCLPACVLIFMIVTLTDLT